MEEFRLTKQLSHKYSNGQTPQTQPSNQNKQIGDQAQSQWSTTIPSAAGTFGGGGALSVAATAAASPTASVPLGGSRASVAETSSAALPKKNKNRSKKGAKAQIYS